MSSSPSLRNKKDLSEEFVDSLSATAEVDVAWAAFVAARRAEALDRIIADENLKPESTRLLVEAAFRDGAVQSTGTAISRILPPVSRFGAASAHSAKKAVRPIEAR